MLFCCSRITARPLGARPLWECPLMEPVKIWTWKQKRKMTCVQEVSPIRQCIHLHMTKIICWFEEVIGFTHIDRDVQSNENVHEAKTVQVSSTMLALAIIHTIQIYTNILVEISEFCKWSRHKCTYAKCSYLQVQLQFCCSRLIFLFLRYHFNN